jgi:integrase/recombinase XerD
MKGVDLVNCLKCKKPLQPDFLYCPYCGKKQAKDTRKKRKRANNSGSIVKLSGNRERPYQARKDGIQIGTYKTYGEADKALARLTDVDIGQLFNMTFAEVYAAMLPELRNVTEDHRKNLNGRYKACSALHDMTYRTLRRSHFLAEILRLEEEGKSKSTVQKTMQLFNHMESWAIGEGIIQANRVENLTTIAKQKTVKRALTDAEVEKIRTSSHRAVPVTLIILGAGCRTNEIFKVKTADCHEDYFVGGSKTKAGERRTIMISSVGLPAYQKLRADALANNCELLIDAYSGNTDQRNFVKRDLKPMLKELGIEGVTLHNLRHTMITNALESGVDQIALTQMVGHADIETTKLYTHMRPEHLRKEIQKIK